ncbi:MAG TPA: aminotransferase class I/II-fold pyridoxal phosphate-dependent enzyme [Thermoanaerobaculia bacterium]|nr:aminotransferase class I/II-fold pyridoxal phosphate-dependent enzyme [Thermoanaerobaculia bacterium]
MSPSRLRRLSRRTRPFQESVIREMTRLGAEVGGVNLAQGLPDFEPSPELAAALERALRSPENHQYSYTWGLPELRAAVSEKTARVNGFRSDPDTEVTITCGVSEGVTAAVLALTEPGDEVLILEPWYENYVPACALAGAVPRFVPLSEPDFRLDAARLARAVTKKSRLLIVNTPGNPSGRVFSRDELEAIAALCLRHGLIAITDEIYEHLWYDGHRHVSLASLPGMADRTVTLSGLGKTYAVTGWRVGWAIAAAPLAALVRKVHDYLTICAPTPFQVAGVTALALPDSYYENMRRTYAARRTLLLDALSKAGLTFTPPEGAYYVMADAANLGWKDDRAFVDFLARQVGVVAVPGSSFYRRGGKTRARFNFAKKEATLRKAVGRLEANSLGVPKR